MTWPPNRDELAAAARCAASVVAGTAMLSALALFVDWWTPAALVVAAGALTLSDMHRVGRL